MPFIPFAATVGAALGTSAAIGGTVVAGTALAVGSSIIKSNAQKEAQANAQTFANEQAAAAREEQQRIEEKFGLTEGELAREDRAFELEQTQQEDLERRAGLPGEDLLKELGPTTRQLLETVAERQGKTGEELFREEGGDVAGLLLDQLSSGDPLAPFAGELELVRQQVNQATARRGVFSGEIRLEQLGRAGVDLAIKSSRERLNQQNQLATQLFNIEAGARQEAGQVGTAAGQEAGGARDELSRFLADIQTLQAGSKGRETQLALGASSTAAGTIQQSGQTQQTLLGLQAGQAARASSDITSGLAGVGTTIAQNALFPAQPVSKVDDIFAESRTEDDPLLRLGALSGGGGFI